MNPATHQQVAALFPRRWDHHYVASKLRMDPLYDAVYQELDGSDLPLLDLGCGLGLLAFYLRARRLNMPIICLDYDERKIKSARQVKPPETWREIEFNHHDARFGLPDHQGNVTILDILQFFTPDERQTLLNQAVERVAPGGKLVIRSGLKDDSMRFKITVAGDLLAKLSFWMKAAPIHYPVAEDFIRILSPHGETRITPLYGKTPFNNHLIVLRKNP